MKTNKLLIAIVSVAALLGLDQAYAQENAPQTKEEAQTEVKTDPKTEVKQEIPPAGFRKGVWGDSKAICKEREKKADECQADNMYAFTTEVAGMKALASYQFTYNHLSSGKYLFVEQTPCKCVADYKKLLSLLTKKYGKPVRTEKKSEVEEGAAPACPEGDLVRDGKLSMSTWWWYKNQSFIVLTLGNQAGSIALTIEYFAQKEFPNPANSKEAREIQEKKDMQML